MPARALAGRRVLLVEDEYYLAEDMNRALQAVGAEVLGPVPSVRSALALIDSGETPDAAVLDVCLGGEMVYPVIDALAGRGVPCLFATGYDRAQLPERYAAVSRLEKPFDPSASLRELARLLRR